jgi:amidophosphoribosyltransferase
MCGIFAIYDKNPFSIKEIMNGLSKLQHRGKDGFGLAYQNTNNEIKTIKKLGLISEIQIEEIYSNIGIGHVRYSTQHDKSLSKFHNELQPLMIGNIALAHNGNIPNVENNVHDSLYIIKFLSKQTIGGFENRLIELMNDIYSAYSLVIIYNDSLYVIRDRYGIRPLSIAQTRSGKVIISSETCAFPEDTYSMCDVNPGEIIRVNKDDISTIYNHERAQRSLCAFELIYFMNPESQIAGRLVRNFREDLGAHMAKKDYGIFNKDKYIVVGVPSSGIMAAKSYAKALGLNYEQYIQKRFSGNSDRTFILPNQTERIDAVNKKFVFDEESIKGKNIILVDDTIVRGNIMKGIINKFKAFGANEIHVRIPAPPVIDICQLGIAIHSKEELITYNKKNYSIEIASEIGANSLKYLTAQEVLEMFPDQSYMECFGINHKSIDLSRKYSLDA